jgi:ABC-2 type transport system permease protein/sodium transport system permease protein
MDAPVSPPQARPDTNRWLRLARKELREILRDRRTLLTLALMPLLLYPLLGFAFFYAYGGKGEADAKTTVYRLGFESREAFGLFREFLEGGNALVTERTPGSVATAGPGEDLIPKVEYTLNSDLAEALRWGQVDLAVYPHLTEKINKSGRRDRTMEYEIAFDPDSTTAKEALRYVHGRLLAADLRLLEEGLKHREGEAPPRFIRILPKPTPRDTPRRGFLLAVLVPLVLILMTMTGAVYPAIDLTAGERERGTLEMLMATPISRVGLLAAKYLAVVIVAVLTALVNLLMMAVTMAVTFVLFGSGLGSPTELGVSLGMIPVVLFLVILFAAFYAAVLLVVAGFARSFKEAQAYIVPLTLISLVPGLLALLPDLQLDYRTAFVPLLNIVLLARDLLSGYSDVGLLLVVVAATTVYGYLALVLASRTFGAEAVLYSDGRSWSDWIRRRT